LRVTRRISVEELLLAHYAADSSSIMVTFWLLIAARMFCGGSVLRSCCSHIMRRTLLQSW
jgi:hypothetical protein